MQINYKPPSFAPPSLNPLKFVGVSHDSWSHQGDQVLLCGFSSLGGRLVLCVRHVLYSVGTHFLLALWQACDPLPLLVSVLAWRRSKVAPTAGVKGATSWSRKKRKRKKCLGQFAGSGWDWPVEGGDPSGGDDPRRPRLDDTQGVRV